MLRLYEISTPWALRPFQPNGTDLVANLHPKLSKPGNTCFDRTYPAFIVRWLWRQPLLALSYIPGVGPSPGTQPLPKSTQTSPTASLGVVMPGTSRRASANAATDDTAATAESRQDRKRRTDRVAQRNHRRRQKLYIEELEAEVALLKSASETETAARHATQNLHLQKEVCIDL